MADERSFPVMNLTDDDRTWIIDTAKRFPFEAQVVRVTLEFCDGDRVLAEGLLTACAQLASHPFGVIAWCHGRV